MKAHRSLFAAACFSSAIATGPAMAADFACPQMDSGASASEEYGAFLQGDDGWFFRTAADLKWNLYIGGEAQSYLARLNEALTVRGTRLVFVAVPPRGLVEFDMVPADTDRAPILTPQEGAELYHDYRGQLLASGISAPDLLTSARELEVPFYFKRDHHWTPEGARHAAGVVAAELRDEIELEGLGGVPVLTQTNGEKVLKDGMALAISRLCDDEIPPEPYVVYETEQQASDAADLGLFGNSGAYVVLLGTSFSDVAFLNFDGFLSEELGVVVANHAVSGGQISNSAISYFSSREFEGAAPDAIVWEVPSYYDINGSLLAFRQIVPAAIGACAPDAAIAQSSSALSSGLTIDIPAERQLSGVGNFAFIEVDDPSLAAISVEFTHADGETETVPIDRSGRFDHEGRFFLELSADITAPVTGVHIAAVDGTNARGQLRFCAAPDQQQAG